MTKTQMEERRPFRGDHKKNRFMVMVYHAILEGYKPSIIGSRVADPARIAMHQDLLLF